MSIPILSFRHSSPASVPAAGNGEVAVHAWFLPFTCIAEHTFNTALHLCLYAWSGSVGRRIRARVGPQPAVSELQGALWLPCGLCPGSALIVCK